MNIRDYIELFQWYFWKIEVSIFMMLARVTAMLTFPTVVSECYEKQY